MKAQVSFLEELTKEGPLSIVVGAGFSKSSLDIMPLFGEITAEVIRLWARTADGFRYAYDRNARQRVYEWISQNKGRLELIASLFKTASGRKCLLLPKEWSGEWPRGVRWNTKPPGGLVWALPSPAWVLARLIAERVVDTVISINWDTIIETYAYLMGIELLVQDNRPNHSYEVTTLRVIETREDYYHPSRHETELLKINGGAFSARKTLRKSKEAPPTEKHPWELFARRALVISATDLASWRGEVWAEDLLKETLRHHKVLLLGVSARDNVFYSSVKDIQIEELRVRERRLDRGENTPMYSRLFALGYNEKTALELIDLMTYPFSQKLRPLGTPKPNLMFVKAERFPKWASGMWSLMHQIYARMLIRAAWEIGAITLKSYRLFRLKLNQEAEELSKVSEREYWALRKVNPWLTIALNTMLPAWSLFTNLVPKANLERSCPYEFNSPLIYPPFFKNRHFLKSILEWISNVAERFSDIQALPAPGIVVRGEILIPPLLDYVEARKRIADWSKTFALYLPPIKIL